MTVYNFGQLEQLWTSNGGSPSLAPTMAAIALAESGGNSASLNNNPSTGDYSVGLWQINYYGDLAPSRTQAYGAPAALQADPNAQARAAVSLAGDGGGLGNWSTYKSGAYKQYLNGATPYQGVDATLTAANTSSSGSGAPAGNNLSQCAISSPNLPLVGGSCLLTKGNLKAMKGGLLLAAGGTMFLIGGLILVAYGFERTGAGQAARTTLKATPARSISRARTRRRAAQQASQKDAQRRADTLAREQRAEGRTIRKEQRSEATREREASRRHSRSIELARATSENRRAETREKGRQTRKTERTRTQEQVTRSEARSSAARYGRHPRRTVKTEDLEPF